MGVDQDLEYLMSHLGDFGKYQLQQFSLLALGALTAGMHMLSLVTVAAVPKHRCAVPTVEVNGLELPWNSSEVLSWMPNNNYDSQSSCHLFDVATNKTYNCDSWVYDKTYYQSSRAIDWNMVCDRRWMGAVGQMIYMLGVFTGAVTLGSMADKFGRKKIFCLSAVGQLIAGVAVAFASNYYIFLVINYVYGIFGSAGAFISGYVLAMEIIGSSKRTFYGIATQLCFAVGICLVAFWGWLIKDKFLLQLVYGLHGLLLIGHWWLIEESPRWLWANGQRKEAVEIVEKGMKINNPQAKMDKSRFLRSLPEKTNTQTQTSFGILDLFKTPQLRMRSIIMCINWFAASLGYYGLSLGTSRIDGNPYIVLFLMAFIEMPSYIIVMFFMDKTGRRSMNSTFLILGSFSLLAAAFIPKNSEALTDIVTTITYFGKFCVSGSFAIVYNYSAEMFPTVLRNTGIGVGSMCARLSASLTPLIALLDSFDERVPMCLFALIVFLSGLLSMLMPETVNQPMPQSLEDGETFLVGDTCCTTGCFPKYVREKEVVPMSEVKYTPAAN